MPLSLFALWMNAMANNVESGPWVAFRHDSARVLLYVGQAKETASPLFSKQLPEPAAHWGGGGYPLPLPAERFSALQFDPHVQSLLRSLGRGETLTVRISPSETLRATVDGFVEQWGGANPQVQIGVLAHISTAELTDFQTYRADYFLAYRGETPSISAAPRPQEIVGPRHLLNSFGPIGELIVVEGDEGWNVALWRRFLGKLMPTNVAYSYGD